MAAGGLITARRLTSMALRDFINNRINSVKFGVWNIALVNFRERLFYFCDETSHTGDEYMAVGGICVRMSTAKEIDSQISSLRHKLNITGEIKWNNTGARRDSGQKAYADLLRHLVDSGNVHLHVRFQPMRQYDHRLSGARRRADTVSKAYYQLILHRPVKFYGGSCDLYIRPDGGECTAALPQYIGALNSRAARLHRHGLECVRSIEPRESRQSHHLQLLDVTLGALAALRNSRHEACRAGSPKVELARYVHALWGDCDLSKSSPQTERKFNIWNVSPSLPGRGP